MRKYHISALYVVDLQRFRQLAAGDRLRGQYQMLSRDPNRCSAHAWKMWGRAWKM